jgi:hypothetical protein
MKFENVNVTMDYVEKLISTPEFQEYVRREADEEVFDNDCVVIEKDGKVFVYKYICDGLLCFKQTFYLI